MTLKKFQFERTITYEIDPDSMKDLIDTLKIKSIEELESLIPDGPREASNEASYKKVEQIFLPNINVELFWANFNDPGIIFKDRDNEDFIGGKASESKGEFKKNSISYLALWDGEDENNKSLEITLSTQCELEIVEDLDIENDEEIDQEIEEELYECSHMFTFQLANLEEDEDEEWENDWMTLNA
ncbi:hypothetical protein OAZ97_00320 [Prochlorococcus sp. AH-736-E15]|nr:hypothetical protein [Prochlorococcus sp. AH-736-E15]